MDTIRITFLIRSLGTGGAERQLVALARALDPSVFDVTVLCFYPGGALESDLRDSGVRVVSLDKRGRWDVFGFLVRLHRNLRQIQPDILHAYMGTSNMLAVLMSTLGVKTQVVWGVRSSQKDPKHLDWLARAHGRAERLFVSGADLVIANSHAGRDYYLARGFPAEKTIVIPNGIDTDRFRPDAASGLAWRARWNVPENAVLIGIVGRLSPIKGHPTFLDAAAQLGHSRPDVWFVCVGGGPEAYASELKEQANHLGLSERLVWAGTVNDMPGAYNAMDILTSCSVSEGFPNVVGEAMACERVCVVTDVGDSAWVVGETGRVVAPRDSEALCIAWQEVLSLGQAGMERVGRESRGRVCSCFSVSTLLHRSQDALLELSGDPAREVELCRR